MIVRSHEVEAAVGEVGVWLAGEFSGRLPAATIDRVLKATQLDLEGTIAPEELGEMLHRLARARLQRILRPGPGSEAAWIPRTR